MFIFEVSINNEGWQEVHEQIFYDSLYRHLNKVTPAIKEMLMGKTLMYGNAEYRVRCEKDKITEIE